MEYFDIMGIMLEKAWKMEDDGKIGKASEIALRRWIQPNSVRNNQVSKNQTWYGDFYQVKDGRAVRYEIKTACGELAIIPNASADLEQAVKEAFSKIDYIFYCPEVTVEEKASKQFYCFSTEAWIQFLTGYPGRGSLLRYKKTTNGEGWRVTFQSFRSEKRKKASKPLAEYIWNCCYDQITAEEFFQK